jgi:hypothetical protein
MSVTDQAGKVMPLPPDWPGHPLPLMPGDFSRSVPHGMGLSGPLIVRPWDDPLKALAGPNYYGFEPLESDPVRAAPTQYADGGVIYFDERLSWDLLCTALLVIGVRFDMRDFVVFAGEAKNPIQKRYLDQARIISRGGIGQIFGAGQELADVPSEQPLTVEGYIKQFIAEQREKWSGRKLRGTAGGDGDWAKEWLAFGFMVENWYWRVYRIWSRAWLVTK